MSGDHPDHESSDHDLLVAKCASMACMFAATILFGCIPFILNSCLKWTDNKADSRSAKIVQCLLYFGGGVLLATTFVHLLPEVKEVVESLQKSGKIPETRFSLAEVIMCAGFFVMYFLEECIHAYLHRHKKDVMIKDDGVGAAFERGHSVRNSSLVKGIKHTAAAEECPEEVNCPSAQIAETCEAGSCENQTYLASTLTVNELIDKHSDLQVGDNRQQTAHNDIDQQHLQLHQHHHHSNGHGHSHLPPAGQNENDGVVTSSLRGLGIVIALSMHEVFEGLAIGLEDSTDAVWFLFAAVSAHKLVLAFCVGVELIVARTRPILAAVYTITFAIVSPIGIGVGLAVSHSSSASEDSIPSAILQGIACGTLMYVIFFEILSTKHTGFWSLLAMVIGFGLMFGLQNIGEGDHDDHPPDTTTKMTAKLMDVTAEKLFG